MKPVANNSARQCWSDILTTWQAISLAIVAPWDGILRAFSERADFLAKRMVALGLDPSAFARAKPLAFFDLQRRCAACDSYGRCEWDLREDPAHPEWRDYCPNAPVLMRLAGRSG